MKEYWEITHERALATQAVWIMQPGFELNKLTKAQHATLTDSLPTLAQTRADKENALTGAIAAADDLFAQIERLDVRVPSFIAGMLDDDDPLKEQLDPIYDIDADLSHAHTLRRARLILPLWNEVNTARQADTPAKPALKVKLGEVEVGYSELKQLIQDAEDALETQAAKQHDVIAAKAALRATDRKLDRGNKRWYKSWMQAYPAGTPEGDSALGQVPTEQGGAADPEPLEITQLTPQANHTILVAFDPAGGAHATTKELLYRLPGEPEFGHTAPITGATMTAGPFPAGALVTFRTRVANSNPGTIPSTAKSAVAL